MGGLLEYFYITDPFFDGFLDGFLNDPLDQHVEQTSNQLFEAVRQGSNPRCDTSRVYADRL